VRISKAQGLTTKDLETLGLTAEDLEFLGLSAVARKELKVLVHRVQLREQEFDELDKRMELHCKEIEAAGRKAEGLESYEELESLLQQSIPTFEKGGKGLLPEGSGPES